MKKRIFLLIFFFLFVLTFNGFSNGNLYGNESIKLINGESSPFYFVVDPKGLYGSNPYTPWFYGRVLDFFKAKSGYEDFMILKPGEEVELGKLSMGLHLVVGFFYESGRNGYPIKVLGIRVWNTKDFKNTYTVEKSPVVITTNMNPSEINIVEARKPSGFKGKETSDIPTIVSFSEGFKPLFFYDESGGRVVKRDLVKSLFWNRGGTALRFVKGYVDYLHKRIELLINARDNFSENTSIFLYVYQVGNPSKNSYTVEIKPIFNGENGGIVLWERGREKPIYIGDVTVSGNSLVGMVAFSMLPWDINSIDVTDIYLELSTAYFNPSKREVEEFVLTTICLKDLQEF